MIRNRTVPSQPALVSPGKDRQQGQRWEGQVLADLPGPAGVGPLFLLSPEPNRGVLKE